MALKNVSYGSEKGPTGRKRDLFETLGFVRKTGRMIGRSGKLSYGVEGEKQARRAMRNQAEGRAVMFSTYNKTRHTHRKLTWKKPKGMSYPKQRA